MALAPWKPAVELPRSRQVGPMIELPTICGKHVALYPAILADQAKLGHQCVFVTMCPCDKAYLIRTELDGAHCRAEGSGEEISEIYEALAGDEYMLQDFGGVFFYKQV